MSERHFDDKSTTAQTKGKVVMQKITPQLVAQALVILAVFGVFIFALPNLPQTPSANINASYKGVVNLWLVDSFEGGSGSRQSWLTKQASLFEQQNKGLFVCVTSLTEEQLVQKLNNGQTFDLVCFSRGVGAKILDKLAPLEVDSGMVLDNFSQSGKVNNRCYALPIYTGVYCLFARQSQQKEDILANCLNTTFVRKVGKNNVTLAPMVCGFAPYNSPLCALSASGVKGVFTPDYGKSQYTAYEQFVDNKTAVTLLGTQRDMYRLGKRLELGKMEELLFSPLCAYTDLVSYVGVSASTPNLAPCKKFVEHLLSDAVQQSVVDIAMFSVTRQNLYTKNWYSLCEEQLHNAYVPNLFADDNAIANLRKSALDQLQQ